MQILFLEYIKSSYSPHANARALQAYQEIIKLVKIGIAGKDGDEKAPDIVPEKRDLLNWVSI